MIVCVWGSTKEAVEKLYDRLPKVAGEHSVTWRLADSFTGPVGHACFAPDCPAIEEQYREAKLRVLREAPPDEPAADEPKPKAKKKRAKKKSDDTAEATQPTDTE